jgi:hypothetical protein
VALMCWGQQLVPVVVPSAAHEMTVDIAVQELGQALGPHLEEAEKQHPIDLIETNAQHEVGIRKNDHRTNETYLHHCQDLDLDLGQGRFGLTPLERLAV